MTAIASAFFTFPSLLRRLGPAPWQPSDTLVRRERGSRPPRAPILHELATGRCGCPVLPIDFRGFTRPYATSQRNPPDSSSRSVGPEAISGRAGRSAFTRYWSRSRFAQSKLAPMRLVPTG
jgi:hypothetical protein